MSTKKPRKRKFNSHARAARRDHRILLGTRLICRSSHEPDKNGNAGIIVTHKIRGLESVVLQSHMIDKIMKWQHTWEVCTFAEGHKPGEKQLYRENTWFKARGIQINELGPLADPAIEIMKNKINQNHLTDWGWEAEILPNRKQEKAA